MRVKGTGQVRQSQSVEAESADGLESNRTPAPSRDAFEAPRSVSKARTVSTKVLANEPSLAKLDDGSMPTYKPVTGQLEVNGAAPEDIDQGDIGDCFFLSSLASLAQRNPQAIEDMIKSNGDGTYSVRFYAPQQDGTYQETHVTVDNLMPEDKDGNAVYASSPDSKELWVQVVEKAFAKFQRGYKVINNGGEESDAIGYLTGKTATSVDIKPQSADALWGKLQTAVSANKLTTAGTFSEHDLPVALKQYAKAGLTDLNPKTFNYDKYGLVDGHAYTVMGVSEENGQKYVSLRNPWGEKEPGNDGADDGEFKMKLQDFAVLFQEVTIGG
jgi:hypothetical protein